MPDVINGQLTYGLTAMDVIPGYSSGVLVDFRGVNTNRQLTVNLTDQAGNPLPLGTTFTVNDQAEPYVIGYDGIALINNVEPMNTLKVAYLDHQCVVEFPSPSPPEGPFTPTIDLEVCQ